MSPGEILHRVEEKRHLMQLRSAYGQGQTQRDGGRLSPGDFAFCRAEDPQLPALEWDEAALAADRPALLAGEIGALGRPWTWRDDPLIWHEAIDTGRHWPQGFFDDIDHRPGNAIGDVRLAWEPARLQHLIPLGLWAGDPQDPQQDDAAALLERRLRSWCDASPPLQGIHYISAMECGLRIMAVCYAADLARRGLEQRNAFWSLLIDLVAGHAALIEGRLSLYSSAGNHTIAEAVGLLHAAVLLPELPKADQWQARSLTLLTEEIDRQILPDGGSLEQAFWYLLFIVDLAELAVRLLDHKGQACPEVLRAAVRRGRSFLADLGQDRDLWPEVGDKDGGFALSPYWETRPAENRIASGLQTFEAAGYSILRAGKRPEVSVLLDHGPLGMAPLFGHGHSDALALRLAVDGHALLIDPGTYFYGGEADWRRYFRSTRAHNTVEVDGQDQAKQQGAFQWTKPFACTLIKSETGADGCLRLLAEHQGYRELGVLHRRALAVFADGRVLVVDRLLGEGRHRLALNYHCDGTLRELEGGWLLESGEVALAIALQGGDCRHFHGSLEPLAGWRSKAYGTKAPCAQLQLRYDGDLPHSFTTHLVPKPQSHDSVEANDDLAALERWLDETDTY